ncbi:NnrS family protein [Pseudohalioglobus sediminis]|uniref:NnrS family protein n=1 Tax=Pseudohalioglobus sediminis TaxID=2606449 RepID=A0A5B0WXI2_9GAMM|nr:NnrS family protein [Pseudohalioglobus sediminis]KAA1191804.1 NnrS family protein [Pseudohalioglobus sediminis]
MSKLLSNGQIVDREVPQGLPFFRLAFRPFFLLGSLFSVVSLMLWAAVMAGTAEPALYGGALWWHVHEMLFGFVAAIVVGFLLTAVQTWTGVPGLHGPGLAALVALWLSARLGFAFSDVVPHPVPVVLDLLFLPVAAAVLARSVVKVRQWRNIVFVPVLLLMTLANGVMHWSAAAENGELLAVAGRAMVLLVTLLMTIIAGRVVPMFTANGTGTERVESLPWLEKASMISILLAVPVGLAVAKLPSTLVTVVLLVTAAIHGLRVFRWRFRVTLRTPLVWSLHLSYWCIPLGLLLYGLSGVPGAVITQTQAIHTLTVGGMGMMILAMISRVSLGHTGRPIRVGAIMALAFVAVYAAFIVRVFGIVITGDYLSTIITAVVLWAIGYGCFVACYLPILVRGRIDGRPG